MKRKAYIVFETPDNRKESDEQTAAVQKILNIIANNYVVKAANIILLWSTFIKAPDEFSEMVKILIKEKSAGLIKIGGIVTKIKKKLSN